MGELTDSQVRVQSVVWVTDRNRPQSDNSFAMRLRLEIVQSQIALLTIEKKHFFEGHNEVLPLLQQDMADWYNLLEFLDATQYESEFHALSRNRPGAEVLPPAS